MSDNSIEEQITFKVLIVDDIPENLTVLSNILYQEQIEISVAIDGKQALKSINIDKPDLILLDISMPEMDGFQVCEKLKQDPETKEIPIIFLTAKVQPEDVVKGFKIGAVDYITKPFNPQELISRVDTHLKLKHSQDIITKQNQHIKKQNKELKELNATKDKFFSIIAHDLKSPFNTLVGFSQLLVDNFEKYEVKKVKKFIHLIYQSSLKGFTLLENLLNWSRAQTNRIKQKPQNIDLFRIIDENITLLSSNAHSKKIEIINNVEPDTFAYADENMITTVVRNLLSNALKFTKKEGWIKIWTEEQDQETKVCIQDTGVGMDKETKEKLFKIDEHVSTKGTANEEGSGLGLILCREFVEKNNGKIGVESEISKGSTFYFTLPLEP